MVRLLSLLLLPMFAAAQASPQVERERFKDWNRVCTTQNELTRCEAVQVLSVKQGEQDQPFLRATLTRVGAERILELALPLGMDLRAGLVMQLDGAEEFTLGYTTCVPQGCASVLPVSDELRSGLKAGAKAKLGFRLFGTRQTQVVELSLSGFTAASAGI